MQWKARIFRTKMNLVIRQIDDIKKIKIVEETAFISEINGETIIESQHYKLSVKKDEMTFYSRDDEKIIEGMFSPKRETRMVLSTEYGQTSFDVLTQIYAVNDNQIELKYKLFTQGQLVETFHFEFEYMEVGREFI